MRIGTALIVKHVVVVKPASELFDPLEKFPPLSPSSLSLCLCSPWLNELPPRYLPTSPRFASPLLSSSLLSAHYRLGLVDSDSQEPRICWPKNREKNRFFTIENRFMN